MGKFHGGDFSTAFWASDRGPTWPIAAALPGIGIGIGIGLQKRRGRGCESEAERKGVVFMARHCRHPARFEGAQGLGVFQPDTRITLLLYIPKNILPKLASALQGRHYPPHLPAPIHHKDRISMSLRHTLIYLAFTGFLSTAYAGLDEGVAAYDRGDFKSAAAEFKSLAEQGEAAAQFSLGFMYNYGLGVPQDYTAAVKWYRLAAEQGEAAAQFSLGIMYDQGRGIPQDYTAAVKWYRLAAEQGDAVGQFNLGGMYDNGRGVPQNKIIAYALMNLAAVTGDEQMAKNRGLMLKQMTPREIATGQDLTRNMSNNPIKAIDAYLANNR